MSGFAPVGPFDCRDKHSSREPHGAAGHAGTGKGRRVTVVWRDNEIFPSVRVRKSRVDATKSRSMLEMRC